jgi:hypothetical protein
MLRKTLDLAASEPDAPEQWDFLCECGDANCVEHVRVSLAEYQEVRSEHNHFVLLPGHEQAGIESAVWRTDRFVVVEKQVEEVMLEKTDPRS